MMMKTTHIYVGVEGAAPLRRHDVVLEAAGDILVELGRGLRGRRRRRRFLLGRGLGRLSVFAKQILILLRLRSHKCNMLVKYGNSGNYDL